jgi:succinoglycan biosynthesis transport protein ExoP
MSDHQNTTSGSPVPSSKPQEMNLFFLVGVLWRRKFSILLLSMLGFTYGFYQAVFVAVPKYASSTTLALQVRNERVVDIESVISGVSTDDSAINTELEVIRSRGLLEKLVLELDLLKDAEFNRELRTESDVSLAAFRTMIRGLVGTIWPTEEVEEPKTVVAEPRMEVNTALNGTVDTLRRSISATNQRNTYVFQIRAITTDRMKSAVISNSLAELYILDQIDVKFQATENAIKWLSERAVELEAELELKENEIKDLRSSMDLTAPEALEAINRQAREVRSRLAESNAEAALQTARLNRLQEARNSDDFAKMLEVTQDPSLRRLQSSALGGDQGAIAAYMARFDALVGTAQGNIDRAEQRALAFQESLDKIEASIADQSAELIELQQLERDAQATRTLYETFLTRLKETSVQRGLQQADSRVLSRATPGTYVEPRKSRIIFLNTFLGIVLGIGWVLFRQFIHTGFRAPDELERATGLPLLGQIPKMPLRTRTKLIPYLNSNSTSGAVEAIRNLRTSILLSNIDHPPQVIMSTSSVPGEGKTTNAIALAQNFAGLGKRTLLIEGDMRRLVFQDYFDYPKGGPGLVTAITRAAPLDQVIKRDSRLDLDIIQGERGSANAADVFSSDAFRTFIAELRELYDYIIIDTPPVLVVPDARVIGGLVDCVCASVAWDRTVRTQVEEMLRQFELVNVKVAGLVLTQIDPKGMRGYGYGDRYGAYALYGKKYYDT